MEAFLTWDNEAASHFPTLLVCVGAIRGVKVERTNSQAETLRRAVMQDVQRRFKLEELKNDSMVRAYRDLFWSLDIDPTKTRPSGEALLRRVLHGDEIPRISTVVDAYNLASVQSIIPLSGFDLNRLSLPLVIRFSRESEEFFGIGMDKPARLDRKMLIVADAKHIVCIYPYRDAESTKVTYETRNVAVIGYGAPKMDQDQLADAVETALGFISQTSSGTLECVRVFRAK